MGRFLAFCLLLTLSTGGQTTSVSQNLKILQILQQKHSWEETKFYEFGYPLIRAYFNDDNDPKKDDVRAVPKYATIKTDLTDENNVYLALDITNNTFFHLYGSKHPDYPNYKIAVKSALSVEFCKGRSSCEDVLDCNNGLIQYSSGEEANVVYISWKKIRYESNKLRKVIITVQYKGNVLTCVDLVQRWDFQKLVLNIPTLQTVSIRTREFVSTNISRKFDLRLDQFHTSIVRVFQCLNCETQFNLTCGDDHKYQLNSTAVQLENQVIFSNQMYSMGWKEVILCGPKQPTECTLEIVTFVVNTSLNGTIAFWNLTPEIYAVNSNTHTECEKRLRKDEETVKYPYCKIPTYQCSKPLP